MGNESMKDYWDALDRLIKNCPKIVRVGTPISNDAVSLEAGRGKGTIKKSRIGFDKLIGAITEARKSKIKPDKSPDIRISQLINRVDNLRNLLDQALSREMSLVYELYETKKTLALVTGSKVFPIRKEEKYSNISPEE